MFAEVITDISNYNVNKSFYYKIPNELKNKNIIGFRVEVPFGMRIVQGYVIDTFEKYEGKTDISNFKYIKKAIQIKIKEM